MQAHYTHTESLKKFDEAIEKLPDGATHQQIFELCASFDLQFDTLPPLPAEPPTLDEVLKQVEQERLNKLTPLDAMRLDAHELFESIYALDQYICGVAASLYKRLKVSLI